MTKRRLSEFSLHYAFIISSPLDYSWHYVFPNLNVSHVRRKNESQQSGTLSVSILAWMLISIIQEIYIIIIQEIFFYPRRQDPKK
jgi:hypothetical protein